MVQKASRRFFLKASATTVGTLALGNLVSMSGVGNAFAAAPQGKSQVFFTPDTTVDGLKKAYAKISAPLTGKVAIKLHTGEPNGNNLLPIDLIKGLQSQIRNSTLVETNTLYPGPRQTTEGHREVLKTNGWTFCPVDIMDADGAVMLPIKAMEELLAKYHNPGMKYPFTPGTHLSEISVGKNLLNYDSMLVYTHFKGHVSGGFGGSLKNIAIGCSDGKRGKRQIHGDGWQKGPIFQERMTEAGKGILEHFGPKITYINVLKNLSIDCDCDPNGAAPKAKDIGILASTDLLALEQASVDMIYALPEAEKHDLIERIESRSGLRQLEYMELLEMGTRAYDLVRL